MARYCFPYVKYLWAVVWELNGEGNRCVQADLCATGQLAHWTIVALSIAFGVIYGVSGRKGARLLDIPRRALNDKYIPIDETSELYKSNSERGDGQCLMLKSLFRSRFSSDLVMVECPANC